MICHHCPPTDSQMYLQWQRVCVYAINIFCVSEGLTQSLLKDGKKGCPDVFSVLSYLPSQVCPWQTGQLHVLFMRTSHCWNTKSYHFACYAWQWLHFAWGQSFECHPSACFHIHLMPRQASHHQTCYLLVILWACEAKPGVGKLRPGGRMRPAMKSEHKI